MQDKVQEVVDGLFESQISRFMLMNLLVWVMPAIFVPSLEQPNAANGRVSVVPLAQPGALTPSHRWPVV